MIFTVFHETRGGWGAVCTRESRRHTTKKRGSGGREEIEEREEEEKRSDHSMTVLLCVPEVSGPSVC